VVDAMTRRRRRLCATKTTSDAIAEFVHADPAKALVMTCIGQLVTDGHAQCTVLDDRDIELSFNSGETFVLAERGIVRLA
jgi:hypothetical protein